MAFVQGAPRPELFTVPARGAGVARPMIRGTGANVEASFSPNGRWVAYVVFDGASPEVVVGPAGSTERRWPVGPGGRYPRWTAGGTALDYVNGPAIYRIAVNPDSGQAAGKPVKLVDVPPRIDALRHLNPSTDGNRYLMLERLESGESPSEIRVVLNWLEEVGAKVRQAAPAAR